MATIAAGLAATYPASNQGIGVTVLPLLDTFIGPQAAAMLYTMLGAVFGVLLDCLRQRRQPAAGAHGGAQQGGGDSHRARRQPRPHRAAAARPRRWCCALAGAAVGLSSPRWASTSSTPDWPPRNAAVAARHDGPGGHRVRRRASPAWSRCWPARCRRCAPPDRRRRDHERRSARVVERAHGQAQPGAGRRPARRVVRAAGGGRPDDPHGDQRVALRLRVRHQRHLHGAPRPVREGLPHPAGAVAVLRRGDAADSRAGPASARWPSPPTCRRGAGRCTRSLSTAWPIPPSRTTRWPGAS